MRRVAVLLLLGGALVVGVYLIVPTVPISNDSVRLGQSNAQASTETVVAQINSEVTKLEARSPATASPAGSNRDPFHFGAAPPPPRVLTPPPLVAPVVPHLPKLIAITSKSTPAGAVRTATFSLGNDVQLVHPGDSVAGFVVQAIADGYVDLVDPVSGIAYRVR